MNKRDAEPQYQTFGLTANNFPALDINNIIGKLLLQYSQQQRLQQQFPQQTPTFPQQPQLPYPYQPQPQFPNQQPNNFQPAQPYQPPQAANYDDEKFDSRQDFD